MKKGLPVFGKPFRICFNNPMAVTLYRYPDTPVATTTNCYVYEFAFAFY